MTRKYEGRFVADGYRRARSALEPKIRAEVEAEFADERKAAGWIRRWFVQRKIKSEIRRRIHAEAPPEAHY
jgi:hypothetical protein